MNKKTLLQAIHATRDLSVNAICPNLTQQQANENKDHVSSATMDLIDLVHTEGWISVEDRLPDEGVVVLTTAYEHMDESKPRYYQTARLLDGFWFDIFDDDDNVAEPTHWLELPEPPQT